MHRSVFTILLILAWLLAATAQNAPQTNIGSVSAASAGNIDVPVTVWNFNDIGAVYLSVDYDFSVLQLTGATPHAQMPTFLWGDSDLGDGNHRITMGWYGNSLSLPVNSIIMTLHFNFSGGYSELNFYDNGPSCEYADNNGQVLNDIPFEQYYTNGEICGELPNPGPIYGPTEVCEEDNRVAFWVDTEINASDYVWINPQYANIIAGQHTNLVLVEFMDEPGTVDMQVYIANPCGQMSASAMLPVTVHSKPIASIYTIPAVPYGTSTTLEAANGGSGSYSYHWWPEDIFVNPNVQIPLTVNLYEPVVVQLTVTDLATGCQETGLNIIEISGGPLSLGTFVNPDSICPGDVSSIWGFASGGTGNYDYSWSSYPPGYSYYGSSDWVEPDTTTIYILNVDDGYNSLTDSLTVWVDQPVTATISGIDTLCGPDDNTALQVDLTGIPPWNFVYTWGTKSVFIENQAETPYIINAVEPGTYTISYLYSNSCEGAGLGEGSVAQYPIPPTPEVTLYETTLLSNIATGNQWYKNGVPIPGATAISYTATETGTYFDVIQRFGCIGAPSNSFNIVIMGIEEAWGHGSSEAWGLVLYPNPVRDLIHGRFYMDDGRFRQGHRDGIYSLQFTVYNLLGVKMMEGEVAVACREFEIGLGGIGNGSYLIVLSKDGKVLERKRLIVVNSQ